MKLDLKRYLLLELIKNLLGRGAYNIMDFCYLVQFIRSREEWVETGNKMSRIGSSGNLSLEKNLYFQSKAGVSKLFSARDI